MAKKKGGIPDQDIEIAKKLIKYNERATKTNRAYRSILYYI
jgi:hypothetical protein